MSARQNILDHVRNSGLPAKNKPEVPDFTSLSTADFIPQFRRGLGGDGWCPR
jgi:hypothetical protein